MKTNVKKDVKSAKELKEINLTDEQLINIDLENDKDIYALLEKRSTELKEEKEKETKERQSNKYVYPIDIKGDELKEKRFRTQKRKELKKIVHNFFLTKNEKETKEIILNYFKDNLVFDIKDYSKLLSGRDNDNNKNDLELMFKILFK